MLHCLQLDLKDNSIYHIRERRWNTCRVSVWKPQWSGANNNFSSCQTTMRKDFRIQLLKMLQPHLNREVSQKIVCLWQETPVKYFVQFLSCILLPYHLPLNVFVPIFSSTLYSAASSDHVHGCRYPGSSTSIYYQCSHIMVKLRTTLSSF